MYLQRAEEITPNIRYCAYNLGEGGTDINDLMQMRLSSTGGTQDPVLAAKIDVSIRNVRLSVFVWQLTLHTLILPICPSIDSSTNPSMHLFIDSSILSHPFIHPFNYPFILSFIHIFIFV